MILRLFEQDVQISGTRTGVLYPRPLKIMKLLGNPQVIIWGLDIRVSFFDVQDARMSRVHGCTRATLGTSFFGQAKKKCLAAKRRKQMLIEAK